MESGGDGNQDSGLCKKAVFRELTADDPDPEITEIESLCLQCGKNGITKLLFTKIPFYKEVVVMSFSCGNCHWQNNELQPAAKMQEKGIRFKLNIAGSQDLSRQVVKTEWASVIIPEINLEIPPSTQEGMVTTIEGILQRAYDGIKLKQELLESEDPVSSAKLKQFLDELADLKEGKHPFHLILNDSSGNSFLENRCAPKADPEMEVSFYERSREENLMLGIVADISEDESLNTCEVGEDLKNEVLEFPTNCFCCNAPCITKMKLTHIPHFKDVVIMATTCDSCGHNTNEVKSGAGMEPYAVRISLKITDKKDLMRDLLKSDTCRISIPELELDVGPSALSGRYTTVEGLITSIKTQLIEENPLIVGDSAQPDMKERMNAFLQRLDKVLDGSRSCTLILDDPCGNSYLQSIHKPSPDINLTVEKYERTFEQKEELGLNDMKVENYEES